MSNEREMLEFAAKSCGIMPRGMATGSSAPAWNPKDNSADCAAMCAKLEITCLWVSREKRVTCSAFSKQVSNVKALYKDHDNSRLKAWMFAATMVAAKIGGYEDA